MVSTFTPNINLEEPGRGDDVGTWDTPVNANMTLIDLVAGGIATIALTNANVTLSAAQFQSSRINLTGALSGSVTLTFPTSFIKPYVIQNATTNTSAFTVTCATTAAGANVICVPPGDITQVYNSGTSFRHTSLSPPIGGYWDFAGSSVPNWVTGCTVPPFVNCDGTTVSSATYPALVQILGGTTLPDRRGNVGATLNQGTGRMTTASGGVDGNTIRTTGGADAVALTTAQLAVHNHAISDPTHTHTHNAVVNSATGASAQNANNGAIPLYSFSAATINAAATGISDANAGSGSVHTSMQPTVITGIIMIRAG